MRGSLDDRLDGWDAALMALIRQINTWKSERRPPAPRLTVDGWDDAISAAHKLIGDARTQKGLLARPQAQEEDE